MTGISLFFGGGGLKGGGLIGFLMLIGGGAMFGGLVDCWFDEGCSTGLKVPVDVLFETLGLKPVSYCFGADGKIG